MSISSKVLMLSLLASVIFSACSSDGEEQDLEETAVKEPDPISNNQPLPPMTSLICNQGTYLTYDTFGASFLDTYCVSCHHSSLTAEDRVGAPLEVNFDSSELAQLWRTSILAQAGKQGAAMPPNQKVSTQERKDFADWLNCGAPQ